MPIPQRALEGEGMVNKTYIGIEVDFHHMFILEDFPWTENA